MAQFKIESDTKGQCPVIGVSSNKIIQSNKTVFATKNVVITVTFEMGKSFFM